MKIVFVLFPDLTQLDFTGPLQVLSRLKGAHCVLAAKSMAPVATDSVMTINPTATFDDCPQADIICVPGGFGVADAVADAPTVGFIRDQALGAKYCTSVCTGAFLLGVAGILHGKRATTHWAYHDFLGIVGAMPVRERVVRDGSIMTGGGVTAGIDFAFDLTAAIAGEDFAKALQLGLEYDPAPPFNAGAPHSAPPDIASRVRSYYDDRSQAFAAKLTQAMKAAGA